MKNDSIINQSNIKKVLTLVIILLVILVSTIFVNREIVKLQPDSVQRSISDTFNEIKVQLEFKGLTNDVKEMAKDYSKQFDGYCNIIITDDNGKILFHVNNGYISDKEKFSVLVDPWEERGFESGFAYLIDNKNSIKYVVQLETSFNSNKLKEQSAKNSLSRVLFSRSEGGDEIEGENKVFKDNDGSSFIVSSDNVTVMHYEYVASKGLNLYSLYDSAQKYNKFYMITNSLNTLRYWQIIATLILVILFWFLLPLWVFIDAQKRNGKARKWAIITLIFNIIGLVLYLMYRPAKQDIISDGSISEGKIIICPHCNKKIDLEDHFLD